MNRLGQEVDLAPIGGEQHLGPRPVARIPIGHRPRVDDRLVQAGQPLGHPGARVSGAHSACSRSRMVRSRRAASAYDAAA